jgi:hypothetical protein
LDDLDVGNGNRKKGIIKVMYAWVLFNSFGCKRKVPVLVETKPNLKDIMHG